VSGSVLARASRAASHAAPTRPTSAPSRSSASQQFLQARLRSGALQAKLAVGPVNDAYEREADRVADAIVSGGSLAATGAAAMPTAPSAVQRKCAACEGEEDMVRRKAVAPARASADAAVAGLGTGSALPMAQRAFFEPRLGIDLSGVRVHAASEGAAGLGARAFTLGDHIAFAPGQWQPGTSEGRRLLAHELTHVLQQARGAPPAIRRDGDEGTSEFVDRVTTTMRNTDGTGPVEGTVTRDEFAPAGGGQPRQLIHTGQMKIRFDPADCSVTVPFGYNFVQAQSAPGGTSCNDPPAATPVPTLSALTISKLKASVLNDVNRALNNEFDVRLTGTGCPGCTHRNLPIRIDAHEDTANPDTTITIVNRGGRANAGTICFRSWKTEIAEHEGGHQVLGVGDEYPEDDERLRASVPQWFRRERVRRDWSKMGPEEHTRFAMFHERHFNAVKVFLENVFPGCTATLVARPRPIIPDWRVSLGMGGASISGASGVFFQAGLGLGIPLDRLRRWNAVIGPQLRIMEATEQNRSQNAFLLGARLALERSTGDAARGFVGGGFAELGYGWFSSNDYGPGGPDARSARLPYGEVGVTAGLRLGVLEEGSTFRFAIQAEAALGRALGPGVSGSTIPSIVSDPKQSEWARLGVNAVLSW
jgi:hypothetical protein